VCHVDFTTPHEPPNSIKQIPDRDHFEGRRGRDQVIDRRARRRGNIRDKAKLSWLARFRNQGNRVDTEWRSYLRDVDFREMSQGDVFLQVSFKLGLKEKGARIIIQRRKFH
jgi:hypothetical protein